MGQALTNAEMAIMNLLWEADERCTARQIRDALYSDADRSQHGTVQSLLQRLEDKGFVIRDKKLPIHFFAPRVSRQQYAAQQVEALADKLTDGSLAPLITHLLEMKKVSRAEIDRIRKILDKYPK